MNTKIFSSFAIVAASLSLLCMTSCSDNDYTVLDKGSDELAISVDNSDVTLTETSYSETAVTIDWTTGNNGKTGNRIYYTLELSQEGGTAIEYPVFETIQTQQYSCTVEALNEIIVNKWGVAPGATVTVNAKVTASGEGFDSQTASTSFTVTTYKAVTSTLYLIGDATPNGWSADNATEMKRTDKGVFTWEGNLNAGSMKFITSLGNFAPSYNKGASDTELYYRESFDDLYDEQWQIAERHYYKIKVNLLAMTISITKEDGETPAHENLYIIGNETDWSFWKLSVDPLDAFLFRIGIDFKKGGEFKFGTAEGSWENNYKATVDNAPYTDTNMEFVSGYDPDRKWNLKSDELGAYKICVDIRAGRERMMMTPFTPYETIYLVGDATPNGWDLGNATAMTKESAFVQTWTGSLSTGELKFSCDKQSDWNGAWFMATDDSKAPVGTTEKMIFIDKSSQACKDQYKDINAADVDKKWKISDAGTYKITINQLEETVAIVKQ